MSARQHGGMIADVRTARARSTSEPGRSCSSRAPRSESSRSPTSALISRTATPLAVSASAGTSTRSLASGKACGCRVRAGQRDRSRRRSGRRSAPCRWQRPLTERDRRVPEPSSTGPTAPAAVPVVMAIGPPGRSHRGRGRGRCATHAARNRQAPPRPWRRWRRPTAHSGRAGSTGCWPRGTPRAGRSAPTRVPTPAKATIAATDSLS
jgi:hypothetical protein